MLPKYWVVGGTFGWLTCSRRHWWDDKGRPPPTHAMNPFAMIPLDGSSLRPFKNRRNGEFFRSQFLLPFRASFFSPSEVRCRGASGLSRKGSARRVVRTFRRQHRRVGVETGMRNAGKRAVSGACRAGHRLIRREIARCPSGSPCLTFLESRESVD